MGVAGSGSASQAVIDIVLARDHAQGVPPDARRDRATASPFGYLGD
jgi:hypothetical protein